MPDGIFDKIKNIASGGFKFAKDNLPTAAATAFFGPAAGVAATALTKVRNKKENIKNSAIKIANEAGKEAIAGTTGYLVEKAITPKMQATRKTLVPMSMSKSKSTLKKEPVKKMSATKKVVNKKPIPDMSSVFNKKQNTRPDFY